MRKRILDQLRQRRTKQGKNHQTRNSTTEEKVETPQSSSMHPSDPVKTGASSPTSEVAQDADAQSSQLEGHGSQVEDVIKDFRALERDVDQGSSGNAVGNDLVVLLDDLELYLQALVESDYDTMRQKLVEVLVKRDGERGSRGHREKDAEHGAVTREAMMSGDDDAIVRVSCAPLLDQV